MSAANSESNHDKTIGSGESTTIDEFRTQHKTAVLVVLFTDLKDSTDLAEQKGELHSQEVRHKHDQMLREIVERDGIGTVIKTIGDSLMCVFAEPTAAVDRAIEMQRRLVQYNQEHPDESPMSVRIGMHMGQVAVEDSVQLDVFGRHVNRAARVESLADGDQILMTAPVYDSASGWLKDQNVTWEDHGLYQLKGIKEPSRIYEVCLPGASPKQPAGKRIRESRSLLWVAALLLLALAIPAAWFLGPPSELPPLDSQLSMRVARNDQVFTSLTDALPLQTGDQLQLVGQLSREAYAKLIWLDSTGKVHEVASSDQAPVKQLNFPAGEDNWTTLEGDPGTEMVVLLVCEDPFEAGDLIKQIESGGPLGELENRGAVLLSVADVEPVDPPANADGLPDAKRDELLASLGGGSRAPGQVVNKSSEDPLYRADKVRQLLLEKLDHVDGVAFTHQ